MNKWPIVWSVACLNGKYDHYQPCFAETWLRATNNNDVNQPTGAIGGMFSYISQPWVPPMYGQDEMVDVLVESHQNNIKRTLGGVSFDGNMKIIDQYGTNNASAMGTYMCWILFGDPTLTLRNDVPADMDVSHAPVLPIGSTTFIVQATNGEGARATLTLDNEILGSAVINGGTANIEFETPTQPGQATLTVFGYNKITYIATVNIVSSGEEVPVDLTVSANPTIIARGASTTLNAQATGGNWFYTYTWTPSESLNQNNISSPTASPTVTTTYTCIVNSGSYSNSDSCTITVVCPPDNLTATAIGNSIQLQWDAANPADCYKVYRSNVLIAQDLTETSFTDSNLNPGSYSYRVSTIFQDIVSPKSAPAAATIAAPLSVTATANPAVIPAGGSTTLTANVTGGNNLTYTWEPSETLSDPNSSITTATPSETTTYTVTVSSNEETATAQVTIQVINTPSDVTAELASGSENTVELHWQPVDLATSYRVYHNNAMMAENLTEPQYTTGILGNGSHCFTVTAMLEGVESPASTPVCIEISVCIPPQDFTAYYQWNDGYFGTRLTWEKDPSVNMSLNRYHIFRGADPEHLAEIAYLVNVPYNYHYEYLDEEVLPDHYYYMVSAEYNDGAVCHSDTLPVHVTSVTENTEALTLYPNPTTGRITIQTDHIIQIRIVNSLGQTLRLSDIQGPVFTTDLSPFGKGLYWLLIRTKDGMTTKKIIVE